MNILLLGIITVICITIITVVNIVYNHKCKHSWQKLREDDVYNNYNERTGTVIILQCKKCSTVTSKNT